MKFPKDGRVGKWTNAGLQKILQILKTFMAWRIVLVFGIPLVLALPFPPPPFNIDRINGELRNGESLQEQKFHFSTDKKALGASLLSIILGIKTDSMPVYVCLNNTSIIEAKGRKVEKSDLLEQKEGGLLTIPLLFDDSVTQINVPFASTTCVHPKSVTGFAELGNEVKVNGFLPLGRPELSAVNSEPVVLAKLYPDLATIFNMEVKIGYKWEWAIYLKNCALSLFGLIILLSSWLQVYAWMRQKKI
ncbi:MAG: hypothetical protein AAB539_04400 [Patescibacteria group bacterium]